MLKCKPGWRLQDCRATNRTTPDEARTLGSLVIEPFLQNSAIPVDLACLYPKLTSNPWDLQSLFPGHRKQTLVLNPFVGQQRQCIPRREAQPHSQDVWWCTSCVQPSSPPWAHSLCEQQCGLVRETSTEAKGTTEEDRSLQAAFLWASEDGVDPHSHT